MVAFDFGAPSHGNPGIHGSAGFSVLPGTVHFGKIT